MMEKTCRNCQRAEVDYKFQEVWCCGKEQEDEKACDRWTPRTHTTTVIQRGENNTHIVNSGTLNINF